jgi:hypothetical protein
MEELNIPETLGELVKENKDNLAIEQLQPVHLQALCSEEDLIGFPKGTITDAHVISLTFHPNSKEVYQEIHILGLHEELGNSYITSKVVAVNKDLSMVQTKSGSLYTVSRYVDEDISPKWIVHLCAFLHIWGLGRHFGIPHFYF